MAGTAKHKHKDIVSSSGPVSHPAGPGDPVTMNCCDLIFAAVPERGWGLWSVSYQQNLFHFQNLTTLPLLGPAEDDRPLQC